MPHSINHPKKIPDSNKSKKIVFKTKNRARRDSPWIIRRNSDRSHRGGRRGKQSAGERAARWGGGGRSVSGAAARPQRRLRSRGGRCSSGCGWTPLGIASGRPRYACMRGCAALSPRIGNPRATVLSAGREPRRSLRTRRPIDWVRCNAFCLCAHSLLCSLGPRTGMRVSAARARHTTHPLPLRAPHTQM